VSKEYRATPDQWAYQEHYAVEDGDAACLLELRGRVEALEAAQPRIRSGPESPLVERVADAIAAQATSAGIVNDRPARAAILEVSAWLAAQSITITGQAWAEQLRIEAES
jgi:hypothetical protein